MLNQTTEINILAAEVPPNFHPDCYKYTAHQGAAGKEARPCPGTLPNAFASQILAGYSFLI